MAEFLFSVDAALFYFINNTLSNRFFDAFFSFITTSRNWLPVYLIFIIWVIYKKKKRGLLLVLVALILIAVTDSLGFRVLKEYFARPRPFKTLPHVLLPNGPTGTFSFPSNHAMNNFALAVFFSSIFPKAKNILFIIASLIAFSRVYTGVHYPSDVFGGALLGAAFGYVFSYVYLVLEKLLKKHL